MTKRAESKYKINRRLGINLWGRPKSPINKREYGPASVTLCEQGTLLAGIPPTLNVWMSHGDSIEQAPPGFSVLARSHNTPVAAMSSDAQVWRRSWNR